MVSKPRYFIKRGKKIPIYSHDRGVSFSTPSSIIRSQLLCDWVPPWCQWNCLKIEKKIWLSLQARETALKCKVYNISHSMRVDFVFHSYESINFIMFSVWFRNFWLDFYIYLAALMNEIIIPFSCLGDWIFAIIFVLRCIGISLGCAKRQI